MNLRRINLILGKTGTGKSFLIKKNIPKLKKKFKKILIIDALSEYNLNEFEIIDSYVSFLKCLSNNKYYLIYRGSDFELYEILYFIYKYMKDWLFIFEEAQIYFNSQIIYYIIRYGRHKNLSMIFIARRGTELNTEILALVEKVYLLRTTSDYDITYYSRIFGLSKNEIKKIQNLQTGEYLEIDV